MDSEVYYVIDYVPRRASQSDINKKRQLYKKIRSNGDIQYVKIEGHPTRTPYVIDDIPIRVLRPEIETRQLYKRIYMNGKEQLIKVNYIKPPQKYYYKIKGEVSDTTDNETSDDETPTDKDEEKLKKKKADLLNLCLQSQKYSDIEKNKIYEGHASRQINVPEIKNKKEENNDTRDIENSNDDDDDNNDDNHDTDDETSTKNLMQS